MIAGSALAALVGLAEGMAVGAGFTGLLVLFAVGARLVHATRTAAWGPAYQAATVAGALAAGIAEAFPHPVPGGGAWLAALSALGLGAFVGMIAGALAETVAALPVIGRRLGLARGLPRMVLAVVCGKALGAVAWIVVPGLFARPPM